MWEVEFFATAGGKEVVADFLDSLPRKHKAKAIWEIELLAIQGTGLALPYARHIDGELWELRIKFGSDISRIFYFSPIKNKIVLLHGLVKKTDKTPRGEIEIAQKRLLDYNERHSHEF
jgi:phage-related protein